MRRKRFLAFGLLSAVVVVWLALEAAVLAQVEQATQPASPNVELTTLEGAVTDENGRPVQDAQVLVTRKTWPRNRFRQDPFETTTDAAGRYALPNLYRLGERSAIMVSVYHPGHALTSVYHVNNAGEKLAADVVTLKTATPVSIRLLDSQGRGIPGARVVPVQRKTADGSQHLIYPINIERLPALWTTTDTDGRAQLTVLERGDEAAIDVDTGSSTTRLSFKVEQDGEIDLTVLPAPERPGAASRPQANRAPSPPPDQAQVDWVRRNSIVLKSIDPADTDFSDLAPLKRLIGDARIVMLGEQSHGDGAAFHTKTRLIKFLHEQLGFDVLAFESGLYDCRRSWQAFRNQQPARQAAELGVFGIWTGSEQTQPLFEYLAASASSDRPLELAGFDSQMTAAASRLHLSDDIKSLASQFAVDADVLAVVSAALDPLLKAEGLGDRLPAFLSACEKLEQACSAAANAGGGNRDELLFWSQYFRSLRALAKQRSAPANSAEGTNARDEQMAENLAWLARAAYPDRRIIVWAASFHIMANPQEVHPPSSAAQYAKTKTMGHVLRSHIDPQQVFTIAFTAFEGEAGTWARPARRLPTPATGSLEDIFQRTGQQNFVLSLRNTDTGGAWLAQPHEASALAYSPMTADWTRVFDAIIFNREMYPSTKAAAR